jgi:hypothetical protein
MSRSLLMMPGEASVIYFGEASLMMVREVC